MAVPKVHILYEYGADLRPHTSSYVRLLRPLTHPALGNPPPFDITLGHYYYGTPAQAVIIDRLWRPDISLDIAHSLTDSIRKARARLIYAVDDNLLDLGNERRDWPDSHHLEVMNHWLREADVIWVTTQPLKKRLEKYNSNILVLPNQLDERLLSGGPRRTISTPFTCPDQVKIGYMGTLTHKDDLSIVFPALHRVWKRYGNRIEYQFVGITDETTLRETFNGIPIRIHNPRVEEQEYPLFMLWFSAHISWHIAISPLKDTPFTRCKSDIKFLDYCAIGAAGIFSDVKAYQSSVDHKQTGYLVKNDSAAWEEAIERLLKTSERENMAYNATRYLYTQRILAIQAQQWVKTISLSL